MKLSAEQFSDWQKAFTAAADPSGTATNLPTLLAADPQLQQALTWATAKATAAPDTPDNSRALSMCRRRRYKLLTPEQLHALHQDELKARRLAKQRLAWTEKALRGTHWEVRSAGRNRRGSRIPAECP
ncbi:MAG UNVERIFIED_CONTAM: hypothetical protein LVR18_20625 [Planctomycetaceae bacterium]